MRVRSGGGGFLPLLLLILGLAASLEECDTNPPFHPVVLLPKHAKLLDLTSNNSNKEEAQWTIGKYDEDRAIYTQPLFIGEHGNHRTIHVGIDLGAPPGVAVHAFANGLVIHNGVNPADGDYGPTLVVEHEYESKYGSVIYALYGHLATSSLVKSPIGAKVRRGDVLAWIGNSTENGNWPPHLHFQLAWERPYTHDLPGAVSKSDRAEALTRYPDPRIILGAIY